MNDRVGIVLVSHSPLVAEGAAAILREMAGEEVPVAACGGNPDGGLGTDVAAIMAAIKKVQGVRGVAILADLGGAETNSEMAIEMLADDCPGPIRLCRASIVEGAVMAGAEAAGGSGLDEVVAAAEAYEP